MDGVLVEFSIYDDERLRNNTPGIYYNKKPIKYILDMINEINEIENLDLYILSACHYKTQKFEKELWLDKYLSIIENDKRIILVREEMNLTKEQKKLSKGLIIKQIMEEKNYDKSFYIDDNHELLRGGVEVLNEKVEVFHVSSML